MERSDSPPSLVLADDEHDGDEKWTLASSPDIVLLNPSSKGHGDEMDEEEDDDELMMTTPTKPSRSGRGGPKEFRSQA